MLLETVMICTTENTMKGKSMTTMIMIVTSFSLLGFFIVVVAVVVVVVNIAVVSCVLFDIFAHNHRGHHSQRTL